MPATEDKKALLKQLLERKAAAESSKRSFPLSYGQRALWFLHQNAPGNTAYNVALTARIRSEVDHKAWRKTCQRLVNRHEVLRTTYDLVEGQVVQKVHPYAEADVHYADTSHLDEAAFRTLMIEQYEKPFLLESGPVIKFYLFRRAEQNYVFLINIHHIASDGFSTWVMLDEIKKLYAAEADGQKATLEPLEVSYKDFVNYQRELLDGPKGEELLNYWRNQLSGGLPVLDLPLDKTRPDVQSYRGGSVDVKLSEEQVGALRKLSMENGVTLFVTLLSAYQLLMSRYSGQKDVIVGTPTSGRDQARFQPVVGYFVNPVALRARFDDNPAFSSFLTRNRDTVLGGISHQDLPFSYLVEKLNIPRDKGRSPVFQVFFSLLKSQGDEAVQAVMAGNDGSGKAHEWGKLAIEPYDLDQQEGQFDLTMALYESQGAISGKLKFNADLFEAETVSRMAAHYSQLLDSIIAQPSQQISELEILTPDERRFLVEDINQTDKPFPSHLCMHQLFEQQADANPNGVALRMPALEKTTRKWSYTYNELDHAANKLANYLKAKGIGPEDKVGICVHRSPDMVIALLATLKAGAAYVPLDPEYPQGRIGFIAEDANLQYILTRTDADEHLPDGQSLRRIYLDTDWPQIAELENSRPDSGVTADNLAYIIYTSGSTGKPKGVLIEHRGVINKIVNFKDDIEFTPDYRFTLLASYAFDASIGQMFMPLCKGCPLFLMTKEQQNDPESYWEFLHAHQINVIYTAASFLSPMLDTPRDLKGLEVKAVFLGAEAFPLTLLSKIRKKLNAGYIVNMYGPTETTVNCVMHTVKGTPQKAIPLGKPLPNYTAYVLDSDGNVCPVGVPGEIHIGGPAVARGYHNRPELTERHFIPDPFSSSIGARLYRSGDMGKYLSNGDIVFMGRADKQVKVNGYRIEPGEVEAAIAGHPEVKEVMVIAKADQAGNDRLVAYTILQPNCQAPTGQGMKEFLADKLPGFMIPTAYLTLDAFPLTPTGKVDVNALPEPGVRPKMATEFVAPTTEAERYLAGIWQEVLGIPKVGVHDNFFELGGASVQSIQVVNKANEIGFELSAGMLFEFQTVAELAKAAEPHFTYKAPVQDIPVEVDEPGSQREMRPSFGTDKATTLIESVGTYLPPKVVPTDELLAECKVQIRFPVEKMTGIKTRRMAGEDEFALDMAKNAAADCFSRSKYAPADIELLICCNISRYDAPTQVSFEPNTAARIARHFGMKNPLMFDLSNACATMWTGINIADSFIANGIVSRAMVVSGEYITHIAKTAVREIENDFMDRRMACLTVGDSGAAVILEKAPAKDLGFHYLHMYTETELCRNCVAYMTDQKHGGAIMYVESVKAAASAIQPGAKLALSVIQKGNWLPEPAFQHILIHQTSSTTISDARREINSLYNKKIATEENTIDNIAHRGNTATTSHWIATVDRIRRGEIKAGDKMVFGISGSGHTLGTALYTFDDLPDRVRENVRNSGTVKPTDPAARTTIWKAPGPKISIESVGWLPENYGGEHSSLEFVKAAALDAIGRSRYDKNELGLIIHTGVYRDKFLSEPAVAALMAGDLMINPHPEVEGVHKSFTFDLLNSSVGFLQACFTAAHMLHAGKFHTAMVTTSEIENNRESRPNDLLGLAETGSAVILHADEDNRTGFGNFAFRDFPAFYETVNIFGTWHDGEHWLEFTRNPNLEAYYAECVARTVNDLLTAEGMSIGDIDRFFPPQISPLFIDLLAQQLGVDREKLVDVSQQGKDLFTSSLAYAVRYGLEEGLISEGQTGLLIQAGSGIQVGCALYYF